MTGTSDLVDVRRDDEFHLGRFVKARAIGDQAAMRQAWDALITLNYPRIEGFARLEARGRLDADELQDATQDACVRICRGLYGNFRGTTMGEWVRAARRAVHFACIDVQKAAARVHEREGSYDAGWTDEDGETQSRYAAGLDAAAEARHLEEEDALEAAEELAAARAWIDEALPEVSEKQRAVLMRDLRGVPVERIMEELGISQTNVYQRRRRYSKELQQLRERYEP